MVVLFYVGCRLGNRGVVRLSSLGCEIQTGRPDYTLVTFLMFGAAVRMSKGRFISSQGHPDRRPFISVVMSVVDKPVGVVGCGLVINNPLQSSAVIQNDSGGREAGGRRLFS